MHSHRSVPFAVQVPPKGTELSQKGVYAARRSAFVSASKSIARGWPDALYGSNALAGSAEHPNGRPPPLLLHRRRSTSSGQPGWLVVAIASSSPLPSKSPGMRPRRPGTSHRCLGPSTNLPVCLSPRHSQACSSRRGSDERLPLDGGASSSSSPRARGEEYIDKIVGVVVGKREERAARADEADALGHLLQAVRPMRTARALREVGRQHDIGRWRRRMWWWREWERRE